MLSTVGLPLQLHMYILDLMTYPKHECNLRGGRRLCHGS